MEKNETLKKIATIMSENEITLKDIIGYFQKDPGYFDLLYIIDGKKMRLPFQEDLDRSPDGIFPLADDCRYLELDESAGNVHRKIAHEESVPPLDFWERIYGIREELNKKLESLGKPILKDTYFARGPKINNLDLNWIVGMYDCSSPNMPSDYYQDSAMAKIRYYGTL